MNALLFPVVFTMPWVLTALALLPGLWWLLRAIPPSPAVVRFPAIRLLYGLAPVTQTAARTPWWLLLLRAVLASLLILGFAGPVWNPGSTLGGSGPVIVVVDNGWASAADWPARQRAMRDLAARASRAARKIIIIATAPIARSEQVSVAPATPLTESAALGVIDSLQPRPWAVDRLQAAQRLAQIQGDGDAAVFWLSDGVDSPGSAALIAALNHLGAVTITTPPAEQLPLVLAPSANTGSDLRVDVIRPVGNGPRGVALRVTSSDGTPLANIAASFAPDQTTTHVALRMPIEVRNRAARVDITGNETAASVVLLDSGSHIPTIGVIAPYDNGGAEPLLSARYYIERALSPFGDLRRGAVSDLLHRPLSLMVLSDDAAISSDDASVIGDWVQSGGVLLRFAGPNLAAATNDPLLPVSLRQGDRSIGGAMSWETPAHLAPFSQASPFSGLAIPPDVTVSRQVLAEPSPDLESKTWARLSDGTPLVTAEQRGRGWIVLFHTTANADWSNLALSGLFVDMLRRVADLGLRGAAPLSGSLAPWRTLDGFGVLTPPPVSAAPLEASQRATTIPSPDHPPGLYGVADHATALNLGGTLTGVAPLPDGLATRPYGQSSEIALQAPLLAAALLLLIFDIIVGYGIRGLLRYAGVLLLTGFLLLGGAAHAASDESRLIDATGTIHLAYVATGDPDVDATAKAGLEGLSEQLARRTSVVPGPPMAVDINSDDLVIFPLIYWPVTESQAPPTPAGVARINQYLATGGVLLIDTRDQGTGSGGTSAVLDRLLAGIRVPPLEPIPADHVLTRSFYLLHDFPGRWDGGTLWVEPPDEHVNDGVSTLIVGANDWAAAWAVDTSGMPEFSVDPGGDTQREMAYRFGINLVMYALTGNYKADQMHVRAILDRLGQ